jgi:hypothetical protein
VLHPLNAELPLTSYHHPPLATPPPPLPPRHPVLPPHHEQRVDVAHRAAIRPPQALRHRINGGHRLTCWQLRQHLPGLGGGGEEEEEGKGGGAGMPGVG